MKNTSIVIATIVGLLVLFVFLHNLMIIDTNFLTRDDARFVKMIFTLNKLMRIGVSITPSHNRNSLR